MLMPFPFLPLDELLIPLDELLSSFLEKLSKGDQIVHIKISSHTTDRTETCYWTRFEDGTTFVIWVPATSHEPLAESENIPSTARGYSFKA